MSVVSPHSKPLAWLVAVLRRGASGLCFVGALSAAACSAPPPAYPNGAGALRPGAALPAEPAAPKLVPCSLEDAAGCAPKSRPSPTLDASQRYPVRIAADDPVLGPANAPVTVVVFSDFQCPFCTRMNRTLERLRDAFPAQVRIVWKDLPLPMHAHAIPAAMLGRAAYAAGGNPRFWQAHALIYERQASLNPQTLSEIAKQLNIPWPARQPLRLHIDQDIALADALNVAATPTSFVNGRPVSGAQPFEVYEALVEEELD